MNQTIELAPRFNDMAKVHGQMVRLSMIHRNNKALVKVLPYVALVVAGYKKVEVMPQSVQDVVRKIAT